jgi:drug/metabolite transporter (DMT)-like permease
MNPTTRAYLYLHISVVLWGFTAILGDLISLSAFWLVWWRVGITALSLSSFVGAIGKLKAMPNGQIGKFVLIGILIALHWLTFFGAIKYANASIALVALSTTALFTSFIEPWFSKVKLRKVDIIFGMGVIPGMFLVVQGLNDHMLIGLIIGLVSAFLSALFAVLNKLYISQSDPAMITFLELGSSWLFLTCMIPFVWIFSNDHMYLPMGWDWVYLIVLALACTTLTFILHLHALKYISAFMSNLVINLEPVYGIILAAIILGDHNDLNPHFYLGVLIILGLVGLYPTVLKRTTKTANPLNA